MFYTKFFMLEKNKYKWNTFFMYEKLKTCRSFIHQFNPLGINIWDRDHALDFLHKLCYCCMYQNCSFFLSHWFVHSVLMLFSVFQDFFMNTQQFITYPFRIFSYHVIDNFLDYTPIIYWLYNYSFPQLFHRKP
jgi:hypothetical protein